MKAGKVADSISACNSRIVGGRPIDVNNIELAIKFAGIDHILAGSDYPHQIGSIPKMLDSISRLPISPADREQIYGRNTAALLGVR